MIFIPLFDSLFKLLLYEERTKKFSDIQGIRQNA